jgi:predicted kinase
MKLIITKGLPASGKTTWTREWVNEKPKERVRVNRDDIRKQLGPYWVPQREDLVTAIENSMILKSLSFGFSVVVDATNLRGTERFEDLLYTNAKEDRVDIIVKDLTDVPLELCIQRDQQRIGDDHVGKKVIMRMYNKYLKEVEK